MPVLFTLTADKPGDLEGWRPLLKLLCGEGGSAVRPTAAEPVTAKAGKPTTNNDAAELTKALRDAGWGVGVLSLNLGQLQELYGAYLVGDTSLLAKYPKNLEPPPTWTPPSAPAKKASPVSRPASVTKRKATPALTEDEEVELAPTPKKAGPRASVQPDALKVVDRAPIPTKKTTSNVLGRVTTDSIPGALDADPDEDEEPIEADEGEDEEPIEVEEEVEGEVEGEIEVEDAPLVNLPKIRKDKVPTELLSADRMRNIIAVIQRVHGLSKPSEIYRYMLAYAPHVPKIQQHLDAEGSEERMTARITNIVAAMAPGH